MMRAIHGRLLITAVLLSVTGCHGARERADKPLANAMQSVETECRRVALNASRTYSPSRWTDADQSVTPALTFALPSAIVVTSGKSAKALGAAHYADRNPRLVRVEFPRSRGQFDYAVIFWIFSLMNFNSIQSG